MHRTRRGLVVPEGGEAGADDLLQVALACVDDVDDTLGVTEGRVVSDIVNKHGRMFQIGSQQRSAAQFRYAAELVRNGRVGQLKTVSIGLPGDPSGDEEPEAEAAERNYLDDLNPDSKRVIRAYVEPALAAATPEARFQFERLGYFVADLADHAPGRPVFNRAVSLKDSWGAGKGR